MPFTSETARAAGRKSRKKPKKQVAKIKQLIDEELDSGRLKYALSELDSRDYTRVMAQLIQYHSPKLSAIQVATVEDVLEALDTLDMQQRATVAKRLVEMLKEESDG